MTWMETGMERVGLLVVSEGVCVICVPGKKSLVVIDPIPFHIRSGLSVQNPDRAVPGGDLVRNLLRKAAQYVDHL